MTASSTEQPPLYQVVAVIEDFNALLLPAYNDRSAINPNLLDFVRSFALRPKNEASSSPAENAAIV